MTRPLADHGVERAILGSALLSPAAFDLAVAEGLVADAFDAPAHRLLWSAFADTVASGTALDIVGVAGALEARGALSSVGGYTYLASLGAAAPSTVNAGDYARAVLRLAALRRLLELSAELADAVRAGDATGPEIIERHEAALVALRSSDLEHAPITLAALAARTEAAIRLRAEHPDTVPGLATGLVDLDALTGGLHPGNLVILAARPAMGKTALAQQIATRAGRHGARVAIFSLEMDREELGERAFTAAGCIDGDRLRTGRLRQDDWPEIMRVADDLGSLSDVVIDDRGGVGIGYIRSTCRRLRRDLGGLDLVVVDYLQLLAGDRGEREYDTVTAASKGLKALAKDHGCPVLACAQLNRECEKRVDKRPMMSDLRASGQVEQDADLIAFLYREAVYNEAASKGAAELIVRKQRQGRTGTVHLTWRGEFRRFESAAQGESPYASAERRVMGGEREALG